MAKLTINPDLGGFSKSTKFKTLLQKLGNGREQRIAKYPTPLSEYKLKLSNRRIADIHAVTTGLYDFYLARKGSFEAFYIDDPLSTAVPKPEILVRFGEDNLDEDYFMTLLENVGITLIQVAN